MMRIKIDGKTVFQGDVGDWERRPPSEFKDAIKPGAKMEPYTKALMVLMHDAVILKLDLHVTIKTNPKGFSMDVRV